MSKKEWRLIECPSCGAEVPNGAFCNACGVSLPALALIRKAVPCPHCGEEVSDGKFCSACGGKLEIERNVAFGGTQGRKGHKAPRINMAFNPDNHAWIKTRSRQLGISATEFVNTILDNERMKG